MTTAVVLHIFYEEIARDILARLAHVQGDYHLFVTHPRPLSKQLMETVRATGRNFSTVAVSNSGRDVLPFLDLLRSKELDRFNIVLKLHTKRDHPAAGPKWRNALLDALLGERFPQSINLLSANPRIAMTGPEILYMSARHQMYGNEPLLEAIAAKILKRPLPADWGFFAGTMFCARTATLKPLSIIPDTFDFERENDKTDGQIAHAVERLFGLMPLYENGQIATIRRSASEFTIFDAPGLPRMMAPSLALAAMD